MRRYRHLLPALALLLAVPAAGQGPVPPREREALIDLYEATDGEDWINNEGWLGPPGTECDWHGISCACLGGTEGPCPFVYEMDLPRNNLNGQLPRSIRVFRHLRRFSLPGNRLRGELPGELGQLRRLRWLALDGNQFSGEIPPALGALSKLQWFTLSANRLTGVLPASLAGLRNLQLLSFDQNGLTGELPRWMGEWSELVDLGLSHNDFFGQIPKELFDLEHLNEVSLSSNHLTGRLPANIGKPELHIVHLEGNQLSGPIPESILDLDFLAYINVNWNAVYPTSPEVEQFLMDRGGILGWLYSQTLAPTDLVAVATGPTSVRLTWTPAFHATGVLHEAGGYLIYAKVAGAEGSFRRVTTVHDKAAATVDITGLAPGATYAFRVRTFSRPHVENHNVVRSEMTPSVTVSTLPGQPAGGRQP